MKKTKKYNHVGRPSNEEIKKNKKKKNIKIISISILVLTIISVSVVYYVSDGLILSGLMGDSASVIRTMTYIDSNENAGYVVHCSVGYRIKSKKNNGPVKDRGYYCQKASNAKKTKSATIIRVPYYSQNDYKSTSSRCGGGYLNVKGCLPTVGAMVFSALLDKTITPIDMNNAAYNYGYSNVCYSNSYTASFIDNYAASNGVKVYTKYYTGNSKTDSKTRAEILNMLKIGTTKGKCVGIAALEKGGSCVGKVNSDLCYSNVGHFIMFYSVGGTLYESKKVYVNDPARKNGKEISHEKYDLLDIINSSQYNKVRILCKK